MIEQSRRGGIGAARASGWLLILWPMASLTAVLLAGLIGFAEVAGSCPGSAEATFRSAISIRCENGPEVPMNAAAAVVLFAGFGLAVLILLAVFYRVAGKRPGGDGRPD
ncbi:hypothetical protein ACPZ19_41820 [Amycolatopsis lurida]